MAYTESKPVFFHKALSRWFSRLKNVLGRRYCLSCFIPRILLLHSSMRILAFFSPSLKFPAIFFHYLTSSLVYSRALLRRIAANSLRGGKLELHKGRLLRFSIFSSDEDVEKTSPSRLLPYHHSLFFPVFSCHRIDCVYALFVALRMRTLPLLGA